MGFFNKLKALLRAPGSEQREIIESYKAEFRRYDDEHLRQICRTAISVEVKRAAGAVLRERGLGGQDE